MILVLCCCAQLVKFGKSLSLSAVELSCYKAPSKALLSQDSNRFTVQACESRGFLHFEPRKLIKTRRLSIVVKMHQTFLALLHEYMNKNVILPPKMS